MSMRQAIGMAAFVLVVAVAENAFGQGTPEVRVLVYDITGNRGHVPARALGEAARLLHAAGIAIRWIPCPATSEEMPRSPDCRNVGSNTIMLRIVGSPAPGFVRGTTLGFTALVPDGAVYAAVFRDRVRKAANTARCTEDVILGDAIAHEIGHVLLGTAEHAKAGLMKAHWDLSDLKLAEADLLRFAPNECARMRAAAIRRHGGATGPLSARAARE